MPSARFSVRITSRFERDYRRLLRGHPELVEHYSAAVAVLQQDPHNRSRSYPIRKLEGVAADDGQYRLRSGRFRFRYDIAGTTVFLKYCGLRREDMYA